VAVKDLDDNARAVQDLGAGGTLQVADLAWRKLMVDDDELGRAGGIRIELDRIGSLGRAFESLPRLGLRRWRHRADHTATAGQPRQLCQLAAAQQRPGTGALALLRDRAYHFVAQRLHETAQLLEAGLMRDVIDIRRLDTNEHCQWDRGFGLHGR